MTSRIVLFPLAFAACLVAHAADQTAPLPLELPKPFFVGTPAPVQLPNLEKPKGDRRPPFLAPVGVRNIALGATVTSSDEQPVIGELSYVTDGEKSGADGTFVELGPGPQWVQVDLGRSAELFAIVVWHYHAQPRAYHDVVVQISDDPKFEKGVRTLFNNDHDNSLGLGRGAEPAYIETYEGRLIDAKGAKARYVRLRSNGNTSDELNHYIEVEVFGRPE